MTVVEIHTVEKAGKKQDCTWKKVRVEGARGGGNKRMSTE